MEEQKKDVVEEEVVEEVIETGDINILAVLGYKASTQVSKLVKNGGREDLRVLKPYTKLTRDQAIEILNTITPLLSDNGTNSKKERAMFFMTDVLKSDIEIQVEQQTVGKNIALGNPIDVDTIKKINLFDIKIRKMENIIKEQNDIIAKAVQKLLSYGSEVKAIRKLLEIEENIENAND